MNIIKRNRKREQWLDEYRAQLVAIFPDLAGRVDWDTAIYLYNQSLTVAQAIERVQK